MVVISFVYQMKKTFSEQRFLTTLYFFSFYKLVVSIKMDNDSSKYHSGSYDVFKSKTNSKNIKI